MKKKTVRYVPRSNETELDAYQPEFKEIDQQFEPTRYLSNKRASEKINRKKFTQHAEEINVVDQKSAWLEQYDNIHIPKIQIVTLRFLESICADYIKWALQPDSLIYYNFALLRGIPPAVFKKWITKYDLVTQAHETVLHILSARREQGALDGTYKETWVKHTMPIYSPEHKALEEWRSGLHKESEVKVPDVIKIPAQVSEIDSDNPESC